MNPKIRTQWFTVNRKPKYEGRYLALPEGEVKPVFRYWNGTAWQYNRRKKNQPANFGHRPTDKWAGVPHKRGI